MNKNKYCVLTSEPLVSVPLVSRPLVSVSPVYTLLTAMLVVPAAQGQEGLDGIEALEEVVVTARRAEETIQDAPIAVSAFSEAKIQDAGIERPEDFLQMVSNVMFIDTAEAGDTQVIIRGVINTRDVDQSFALLVDGVPQPNPNALNRELVDIQQLEVVKGPVSPLYGRNALGGAIIINTKKPTDVFEAKVAAGFGNGKQRKSNAMISGPLIADQLYGRLSLSYSDWDGVFDNLFLGGTVDFHREQRARSRLIWEPLDNLSFDLVTEYSEVDSSAIAFNLQVPVLQPQFPRHIDVNDTSIPFSNNVRSINPQRRVDVSLKTDWATDSGTFTTVLAYNDNNNELGSDFIVDFSNPLLVPEAIDEFGVIGYTSAPGSIAYQKRNEDDLTVEVRYASPLEQPLRWSVGGSYVEQNREVFVALDLDNADGAIQNPHPGPQTVLINEWLETETEVWSVFAQLSYDVSDRLELSVAARYDDEERVSTNLNRVFVPLFNEFPGLAQTFEYDKFQPRLSFRWQALDHINIYGSYGQGYRAGGFNQPGTRQLVLAVDGLPATTNIQDAYEPEELQSFEIGLKSDWLDGRLRFNAAAFYTTADDTQIFEFTPVTSTRARLNIDETEMQGFELESTFRASSYLELFGSFGYTEATIEAFAADPGIVGNDVLGVPEYTVNLGFQYQRPVNLGAAQVNWFTRLDAQRIGDTPWDINDNPGTVRDPLDLVNLRVGLRGERWSITGWARNLFDEEYNQESIISTNALLGVVNFTAKGQTRTYGLDFEYRLN